MPKDRRIDRYISDAAPFAQPILKHLRKLVHQACPEVEEAIKWNHPSFLYRSKILCFTAAFKAHVAFGFWRQNDLEQRMIRDGVRKASAMGQLGRLTRLADLPGDRAILGYIARAIKLQDAGKSSTVPRQSRPPLSMPPDLADALKRNSRARVAWEQFSPSARRDYIEWIIEAKREETREQRLLTTLEWVAEGKRRHWKHERR